MNGKKVVMFAVLFVVVSSLFTAAQEEVVSGNSCSGFFGSISCFLWGNPQNRAGKGWLERGNDVVGR